MDDWDDGWNGYDDDDWYVDGDDGGGWSEDEYDDYDDYGEYNGYDDVERFEYEQSSEPLTSPKETDDDDDDYDDWYVWQKPDQQRQVWKEEGYPANVQQLRSRTSDEESFIVEWHEDEDGHWLLWSSEHCRWRYAQHEAQDREELLLRAWREAEFHQDKRRQGKIEEESEG
jgi:hypothetical protein